VLWTYFVIKVVPQKSKDDSPSLTRAAENGCISTIPLTEILNDQEPALSWIAKVVEAFIVISVTISFITVGSGLKNFIDGYVLNFAAWMPIHAITKFRILRWCTPVIFYKIVIYTVSFGASISIAVGKPSCFLVILEYFTSAALNLENGAFIAYMMVIGTKYKITKIPLPLKQPHATRLAYVVAVFFLLAVLYGAASFLSNVIRQSGDIC